MSEIQIIPENELKPAKDNPWYDLIQFTTKFDKLQKTPNGWHWLVSLHCLLGVDIEKIQKDIPDEHPLKSVPLPTTGIKQAFKPHIHKLTTALGQSKISNFDFNGLVFDHYMDFTNFVFPLEVFFRSARFPDKVDFVGAVFYGNVSFGFAEFSNDVNFENAVFFKESEFLKTKFFAQAIFERTIFSEPVIFYQSEFFSFAQFADTIFHHVVGFRCAIFHDFPFFNATIFKQNVTFSEAKFKKFAPSFYGAKIGADVVWSRNIQDWPKTEKNKTNEIQIILECNQGAYENLSYHMDTLNKYHEQHFFFRQEMRCRQRLENTFSRSLHRLYGWVADYGYGVGHASLWWFLNICWGFVALLYISGQGYTPVVNPFGCSFFTSIANAHSFLFLNSGPLETCYMDFKNHSYFGFIWAGQTILGIPLLFLLGLTLRVRFRFN